MKLEMVIENMNVPKVSVIIPVYNVEAYLKECLDSVLAQTLTDIEIICVDDGSPDRCPQICDMYAEKDGRIRVLHKKNGGLSDARNTGMQEARGEYIMFLDSDDWLDVQALEVCYNAAQERGVDVVMFGYHKVHAESIVPRGAYTRNVYFDEQETKNILKRRFVGLVDEELQHPENAECLSVACCKLYRTKLILEHGVLFEDTKRVGTEDALFNLMTFEYVNTALYLNKPLYYYRENMQSLTKTYNPHLYARWKNLYACMRGWIEEHDCDEKFFVALNNRISMSILGLGMHALNSRMPIVQVLKQIKMILSDPVFRKAYRHFSLKYMPIHWKLFYGCAKYNCAFGVYVFLVCIKKLKSR